LPAGPLHFKLDVPEVLLEFRTMLIGLREQVRPIGTASVRLTVPAKPLIATIVIVEFANRFASTVELVGVAVTPKSTPVTVTVVDAEDEVEAAVPVTIIAPLPVWGPAVTVRVAFWLPPAVRTTLVGLTWAVMQVQLPGPGEVARLTVPVNPPALVTVIVELVDEPAWTIRVGGVALMVKPRTIATTFTCLALTPVPPVTVTV
jgi:hypothetical protein